MFTKEQLAKWRELDFEFDDFYDSVAVDKKEEDYSNGNNIPTISFKGKAPEKIEINKETLIEFVISGQSRILQNNLNVELITTDSNINFTTKKWTNRDYGFGLKTKVTATKIGPYVLQFKINGKDSNALSLSFYGEEHVKSKYRIVLFGGIDYNNDGSYGSNYALAQYVNLISASPKYDIPLREGDIQVLNSPLFGDEHKGKDVYREILNIIKENFDFEKGTLILYGYSWGGQLLLEFLKYFKQSGINIALLITVDAAKGYFSFSVNNDITDNVKYNLNLYQTKFYKSAVWSHGWPNNGKKVKNVILTNETIPSGEEVIHANIDEYTLLYCAQVIVYALKGIYTFYDYTESEIKSQIKNYASQGF